MNLMKITLFLFAFILMSCGNSNESKEEKETFKINKTEEVEEVADGVSRIILTGNDQMRFNLEEIKVNAGDKVELILKHVGKLGVQVMGHNFVLLNPGVNINEFASAAVEAKDNDYIPENTNNVIVHTKMIGGGEQTSITFDAPEKGTYVFICSFPGHVALMQGKFIVE